MSPHNHKCRPVEERTNKYFETTNHIHEEFTNEKDHVLSELTELQGKAQQVLAANIKLQQVLAPMMMHRPPPTSSFARNTSGNSLCGLQGMDEPMDEDDKRPMSLDTAPGTHGE